MSPRQRAWAVAWILCNVGGSVLWVSSWLVVVFAELWCALPVGILLFAASSACGYVCLQWSGLLPWVFARFESK